MNEDLTYDERYRSVIHRTCIEVNRVLYSWKSNNEIVTQIDINCLFKSYFSKYFKHFLGWKVYNNFIRYSTPIPLVKNNSIIGIHISDCPEVFKDFKNFLTMFNYSDTFWNHTEDTTTTIKDTTTINKLIDYNKLETFKY